MWSNLAWLGAAGAAGTLARFGLSSLVQRFLGTAFPWGTFVVNMLGCFLFGLIWSLAESKFIQFGPARFEVRFLVLTGFMGAFTTFSSFTFENSQLLERADWLSAFANIAGQNVLGLLLMFAGIACGRLLST